MEKEDWKRQGKRNKQKGAEYERLICKIINDYLGTGLVRTPMSGGMQWKGDLLNKGAKSIMDQIHFECKNHKNLHIQEWLRQAYEDAPSRTIPIVVCKVPRLFNNLASLFGKKVQHLVTIDLLDFLMFIKMIDEIGGPSEEKITEEDPGKVPGHTGPNAEKISDLTGKLAQRYAEENRKRKEEYAKKSKDYNKRVRKARKNRAKDFKANIKKGG
jgi:hypothetical protein